MATTLKALEARQIDTRGRARSLGVRVEVVAAGREYRKRSQSNPNKDYQIDRTSAG